MIGAINGSAVGVGLTMTLPMDVRILADNAKLGFVFAGRGIAPDGAASWFLPRIVGISQALEWVLTARVFQAQEALDAGLVKQVLPADEVLPAAKALADEIANGAAPVSAVVSRGLLWRMLGADHPMVAHRADSAAIAELGRKADSKRGRDGVPREARRRTGSSSRRRTCRPRTRTGTSRRTKASERRCGPDPPRRVRRGRHDRMVGHACGGRRHS